MTKCHELHCSCVDFQANIFRPTICKTCYHVQEKHTNQVSPTMPRKQSFFVSPAQPPIQIDKMKNNTISYQPVKSAAQPFRTNSNLKIIYDSSKKVNFTSTDASKENPIKKQNETWAYSNNIVGESGENNEEENKIGIGGAREAFFSMDVNNSPPLEEETIPNDRSREAIQNQSIENNQEEKVETGPLQPKNKFLNRAVNGRKDTGNNSKTGFFGIGRTASDLTPELIEKNKPQVPKLKLERIQSVSIVDDFRVVQSKQTISKPPPASLPRTPRADDQNDRPVTNLVTMFHPPPAYMAPPTPPHEQSTSPTDKPTMEESKQITSESMRILKTLVNSQPSDLLSLYDPPEKATQINAPPLPQYQAPQAPSSNAIINLSPMTSPTRQAPKSLANREKRFAIRHVGISISDQNVVNTDKMADISPDPRKRKRQRSLSSGIPQRYSKEKKLLAREVNTLNLAQAQAQSKQLKRQSSLNFEVKLEKIGIVQPPITFNITIYEPKQPSRTVPIFFSILFFFSRIFNLRKLSLGLSR